MGRTLTCHPPPPRPQASLSRFPEALQDAEKVVDLKADWPKGYSRLGAAHFGLHQWDAAIEAYQKGARCSRPAVCVPTHSRRALKIPFRAGKEAGSSSTPGSCSRLSESLDVDPRSPPSPCLQAWSWTRPTSS